MPPPEQTRSASDSSLIGTRLGRYLVRRPVGEGAMGRVFVAHDPTLDREVALKVLHPDADDPDLEARLIREAKALGRLAPHPEVITVYDAGRDGDAVYIAMELVEGGTLRQWLTERPRTWTEVVAVFARAGSGLAHAHAAGLVHRDFKSDNVLVGSDGRIRVTDFGLARPSFRPGADDEAPLSTSGHSTAMDATLTRSGVLAGTPAYMAPEQFAGQPANVRTDIFSFCVAFYEALYGERPFDAQNVVQLIELTSSGRVSVPPVGSNVPARLRRALLVGLRPDPEKRYASMNDLLAAVTNVTRRRAAPRVAAAILLVGSAIGVVSAIRARSVVQTSPKDEVAEVHTEVDVPVRALAPVDAPVPEARAPAESRPDAAPALVVRRARPQPAAVASEPPPPAVSEPNPAIAPHSPAPAVSIGANGSPIVR